jgi:hypothetical protein
MKYTEILQFKFTIERLIHIIILVFVYNFLHLAPTSSVYAHAHQYYMVFGSLARKTFENAHENCSSFSISHIILGRVQIFCARANAQTQK